MQGTATPRKLSRLHAEAVALTGGVPLTLTHISRAENAHADCLSRMAVDTQEELLAAAVLSSDLCGRRGPALELLFDAARRGLPRPTSLYDELLKRCDASSDWSTLLAVFRLARAEGSCSDWAIEAALRAHEASGSLRGAEPAELRRSLAARARRPTATNRPMAAARLTMCLLASASLWRPLGVQQLHGNESLGLYRLVDPDVWRGLP